MAMIHFYKTTTSPCEMFVLVKMIKEPFQGIVGLGISGIEAGWIGDEFHLRFKKTCRIYSMSKARTIASGVSELFHGFRHITTKEISLRVPKS